LAAEDAGLPSPEQEAPGYIYGYLPQRKSSSVMKEHQCRVNPSCDRLNRRLFKSAAKFIMTLLSVVARFFFFRTFSSSSPSPPGSRAPARPPWLVEVRCGDDRAHRGGVTAVWEGASAARDACSLRFFFF
jgi:hypothetical protein